MLKHVTPASRLPLFSPFTTLQKSFIRQYKFIRTLEADSCSLLRRLISRVKVLFNLQGEAHGFIRNPVFPDNRQMRFLLTQSRFLKTFVSNLGCGMKYNIEERKLSRHFRNLTSEYFNILEADTWSSIARKTNFKKARINVLGLNELFPVKIKINENLFASFIKTRAHRMVHSLIRAKNLKTIDISYSELDGSFEWVFQMIENILPILSNRTSVEFNLFSGCERHALTGIGKHGNFITIQLPVKKIPTFTELLDDNKAKYFQLKFESEEPDTKVYTIDFSKIIRGRFLLEKIQEAQNEYLIPETISNLFLRIRADPTQRLIFPENSSTISTGDLLSLVQVRKPTPIIEFLLLENLTNLNELELEYEFHQYPDNLTFLDTLKQIQKLDYLSIMIKLKDPRPFNLLEFLTYIKHLLKHGLKGLELKFDISLQNFSEKIDEFKSIERLRILGEISPVENLEVLLQSLQLDKLWLEGIPMTSVNMKRVFQDIGSSLRGNDIKLRINGKNDLNSNEDFWNSIIKMLSNIKGVKVLNIIFEARIKLSKDDVKKIYHALMSSRCCIEKMTFRVNRGSFVEFTCVDKIYKISSHGFKPPMVKMWIIEQNGNWTEVFSQKDSSPEDFKKLGIPML